LAEFLVNYDNKHAYPIVKQFNNIHHQESMSN